jgi:hypothetical protein
MKLLWSRSGNCEDEVVPLWSRSENWEEVVVPSSLEYVGVGGDARPLCCFATEISEPTCGEGGRDRGIVERDTFLVATSR